MRQIYGFRSLSCHGERGSSNVCSLQRKEGTYVNSTELSLHSGNFMTRSLALKVWVNLIQKRNKVTFICTKGISVLVFDIFTLVKLFMFLLIRNSGICLMIFWIRWKLNFFKTHSEIDRYCPLNQLYCCIRKLQTREFFPVTFEFGNYLFICYPKICIRQNTDHREWWNGNLKISWLWALRQGNFEHKHGFTPLTSSPINPVQLPSWRFEPYLKSATCFMSKVTLSSGSIFFRRSGINPSNWADPPCFWITNGSSCKTRDETFKEIIWLICLIGLFLNAKKFSPIYSLFQ